MTAGDRDESLDEVGAAGTGGETMRSTRCWLRTW